MSQLKTPKSPRLRLAVRVIFTTTLAVISAIAAFGIAGEPKPLGGAALLGAAHDDNNWILPAKTYTGNRYTNLAQINPGNVKSLRLTWRTAVEDDGEQEAAPLIWSGTMYVSTPQAACWRWMPPAAICAGTDPTIRPM